MVRYLIEYGYWRREMKCLTWPNSATNKFDKECKKNRV